MLVSGRSVPVLGGNKVSVFAPLGSGDTQKLCVRVRTLRCRVLFDEGLDAFNRQPVSYYARVCQPLPQSSSQEERERAPVKLMSLGTVGTSVLMTLLKSISCSSRW